MKLRHPLSGAVYTKRGDGNVLVEAGDRSGVFSTDGRWLKGEMLSPGYGGVISIVFNTL